MVGWRSLAAQGSSPSMALHTWPYAPVPRVASRSRRTGPKRKAMGACSVILTSAEVANTYIEAISIVRMSAVRRREAYLVMAPQ